MSGMAGFWALLGAVFDLLMDLKILGIPILYLCVISMISLAVAGFITGKKD